MSYIWGGEYLQCLKQGIRIGLKSTIIGTLGIWDFLEHPRTVCGSPGRSSYCAFNSEAIWVNTPSQMDVGM